MIYVYTDYLCPFGWRGIELINAIAPKLGLEFETRHFSLYEGNHAQNTPLPRNNPAWKFAEQPRDVLDENQRRSRDAFVAAHAARKQGKALYDQFTLELNRLRHLDKRDFVPETFLEAATRAGLDLKKFQRDVANEPARLKELAKDLEAAGKLAVFGTPTFVLEGGHAAYFRFAALPEKVKDKTALWKLYTQMLESGARIETVKRPRP